ncbi:MAG: biosynthetic-type acetolactate synthase large subunit [Candidatus Omnitrophica bacterium]|nr:biosynthetic-type acetolactate synthase large subunit [Candidatus Omnitrophota bacterium]
MTDKQKKQITGSEVLIKCLENQEVEYAFGIPGGVLIPIFDKLVNSKIKFILTRHEQGAIHMADGYARVTGKPGVAIATSGPGATNLVTGIMTAHMDSIPIVIITGQVVTPLLGKDAFQEADIIGITMPIVKHSYLVKNVNDIPRIIKEAFYIASTGRPGPVLVDIPKDVSTDIFAADMDQEMDIPGYKVPAKGDKKDIERMAGILKGSKKPLLLVGHGSVISSAEKEVKALAEKLRAPVVSTLLGKGGFPESHDLSLGMLGMHGTAYANKALINCDLILSIGSRWDDRINGNTEEFCIGAKKLHIDIDEAEIGKIVKADSYVVGDAKLVLRDLIKLIEPLDTSEWLKECEYYKKQFPLKYDNSKGLTIPYIIDEIYHLTKGKAIVCTDVGQNQMWSAQFYKIDDGKDWYSSGGAGTMGCGFPAAVGAQFGRPKDIVVAICGDGGFQMTIQELSTMAIHKLPVKVFVMDNKYLGMVRQWQELFFDNRLSGVDLLGNPDFVKVAEGYGIKGININDVKHARARIKEALDYKGPVLIHCEVHKEYNVFPMIPAGKSAFHMMIDPPKAKK